jgi:copper(I)-binding protein
MPAFAESGEMSFGAIMRLLPLALALVATLSSGAVFAQEFKAGSVAVKNPWSRATPQGAKIGAGYMEITNRGSEPDRLVSLSTPASAKAEIHEMKMDGSVMQMRALPNGLAIPPGKTVSLAPGGFHLMFVDLAAPLKQGQKLTATLVFERAGRLDVEFTVQSIGARAPAIGGGHHHH